MAWNVFASENYGKLSELNLNLLYNGKVNLTGPVLADFNAWPPSGQVTRFVSLAGHRNKN